MEDKLEQACIRQPGHNGPCNGFPRKECEVIAELTRRRDEAQSQVDRKQRYINGCRQIIGTQGDLQGEIGALMEAKDRFNARIESLEDEIIDRQKRCRMGIWAGAKGRRLGR